MPKKPAKKSKPTRKRGQLLLDITVGLLTVVLVITGVWSLTHQNRGRNYDCERTGTNHQLTLQADAFSASSLALERCDLITVTNSGNESYRLAFGPHDDLISYPGFTMQGLQPNEYFIITARAAGDYSLHDHIRNKAQIQLQIRDSGR